MVSTFTDYAELAREYQRRAAPRAEPDAAIRERANGLVKDARTDRERVARLQEWINRNVRYLGGHFGVEDWSELVIERDRGCCVPQDERDFIPVREAMRRDLMGQVVFGLSR
jgi:transglutaminase-like putative cysteine protease